MVLSYSIHNACSNGPHNPVNKSKIFMGKIFTERSSYPKPVSVATVANWDCPNSPAVSLTWFPNALLGCGQGQTSAWAQALFPGHLTSGAGQLHQALRGLVLPPTLWVP